jgi:hypothetical protein
MGRRGSISFVIEVKRSRRRLPLALGRTEDPDGKGEVRFGAVRPGGFAATPFSEGPKGYDPTVEAAKVAADRFFNRLGGSESAGAPAGNDLGARGANQAPRTQAAGSPVPAPAGDVSTAQSPAPTQVAQPRTGRVLESLTSINPLEALFRQKAEERAARPRRPRAARSPTVAETQAAVRPESKQGSSTKSATDAKGLHEGAVDATDPQELGRSRNKSRRKTAARRLAKEWGRQSRRRRKAAAKSRRRVASRVRSEKPVAAPKRSARKGVKASVGKKPAAKKPAAKKAGRKVLARKLAARKGATRKTAARNAAKASKLRKTSTKRMPSRGRASTRGRRSR